MTVANDDYKRLLESFPEHIRQLAMQVRELVRDTLPDAAEDLDQTAKLIGFTYKPGSYKGLIAAVAPHKAHVNLMFSKGVELLELDNVGLLQGTGKKARHIRFVDAAPLADPTVRELLREAAARTPRS